MVTIEKVQDVNSVGDDTSMAGTKSRVWAIVAGLGFRCSNLLIGLVLETGTGLCRLNSSFVAEAGKLRRIA